MDQFSPACPTLKRRLDFRALIIQTVFNCGFRGLEVVPEGTARAPHDLPAVRRVDPGIQARLTTWSLQLGEEGGVNRQHQARLDQ